ALVTFAVDTGGRKSELLKLDWLNVDLDRGFVTFRKTKNGEDRSVRLTDRAEQVLTDLSPQKSGPVFTYRGQAMKDVKTSFERARTRAGVEDFRFHDLRHTFASRLVQQGVTLYEVMHLTGHKASRWCSVTHTWLPTSKNGQSGP
ncbi:MAG: site-specific integrase, partial [Magnetovibrio sp.]|nr:site-specific integrase [Magnetovibrio sp.]